MVGRDKMQALRQARTRQCIGSRKRPVKVAAWSLPTSSPTLGTVSRQTECQYTIAKITITYPGTEKCEGVVFRSGGRYREPISTTVKSLFFIYSYRQDDC